MPQRPPARIVLLAAALLLCMSGMMIQFFSLLHTGTAAQAGVRQGKYRLHVPLTSGFIYDRNLAPLNQSAPVVTAVVSPTPDTVGLISAKLRDPEAVAEQLRQAAPFVCTLTEEVPENQHIIILRGTEPLSGARPAQHLLGYRQNGKPAAGLERAFGDFLVSCDSSADVTFTVSGVGEVLAGAEQNIVREGIPGGGIVTTLDASIQEITEQALQHAPFTAGAAVVLDCRNGEILASASIPLYSPDDLAGAMEQPDSPFLNRALSAYSVGSVFKLAVASAALEQGFTTGYCYNCTGIIGIYGQNFRCHRWDGHGLLDMGGALTASCNPYFISLTQILPAARLHDTAAALGFGRSIPLANGIFADSGMLQSESDLMIPAEKANFSFGQGKLLATPLHIAAMTACIANNGIYTAPQLILGTTQDGQTFQRNGAPEQKQAVRPETAATLRAMMTDVLGDDNAKGRPGNTTAGGKTSTAQTGQYDGNGTEYCHAWMTGFFPADSPRYAVTVFGERAGSGNTAAAPVFREIIEHITACS